jgi:hypothetical protein
MSNLDKWVEWLPFILFVFGWLFALFCLIWGIIDIRMLVKPDGKIKRGFKIRTKPLSPDAQQYFMSISEDVIERQRTFLGERISGFIRVKDNEVVVFYRDARLRSSWPQIGYVNLNSSERVMEIRSSLPMYLFLIPFALTVIMIPFVLILVGIVYYRESASLTGFLNRKIEEYKQNKEKS